MKGYIYLITRKDDQKYVGITYNMSKRIYQHKRSKRFEIGIKSVEILKECDTYEESEILESEFIEKYDTYYNGLNESIDGKGNHLAPNFTTKGYKFSAESRQKMKENHWSTKTKNTWSQNTVFSEEMRKQWSEIRKGVCWAPRKIQRNEALNIIETFHKDTIEFDDDFIKMFVKKTDIDKVGKIKIEELKTPNGKHLNKRLLYSNYYADIYGVTPEAIIRILKNGISDKDANEI